MSGVNYLGRPARIIVAEHEDLLRARRETEVLLNVLAGRVRGRSEEVNGDVRLTTVPPLARLLMPAIDAVIAGIGIGFLTEDEARGRNDIHEVVPHQHDWSMPLWLVTHGDLHHSKKVQALFNCIKDESSWRDRH